jgi:hypothetical protein
MKKNFLAALMRNTAAASLALTLSISSSLFVLAATPEKLMGELTVSGASLESDTAYVTIDGERALTGRSVLPSSNITTTNVGATVSLGEAGRVEIAANSSVNLEFTEKSINANLTAGKVKIYNAAGVEAKVTTKDDVVTGKTGEVNAFAVDVQSGTTSVLAEIGAATQQTTGQTTTGQTTGGGISSAEAIVPIAILGGITAVAVIYVLTRDDDDLQILPVSPIR